MSTLGAVRVIGAEALLGHHVESGEESQRFVEVEVVDVTAAFFIQQLQRQQT